MTEEARQKQKQTTPDNITMKKGHTRDRKQHHGRGKNRQQERDLETGCLESLYTAPHQSERPKREDQTRRRNRLIIKSDMLQPGSGMSKIEGREHTKHKSEAREQSVECQVDGRLDSDSRLCRCRCSPSILLVVHK